MTTLGFAVVVSLAGLAPPTAQAQTESYITEADLAAACDGVCNTYVPPQTEDECEELWRDRQRQAYNDFESRQTSRDKRRQKALDLSADIYRAEYRQYLEEYNEKVKAAAKVAAAALVAAQARLVACTAACMAVTPISWTAYGLCLTQHAVAHAGIWLTYDRAVDGFGERFDERNDAAKDSQKARDFLIQTKYEGWIRELNS